MDKPFIIWTFRRTGGTTLADLLMSRSSHPTVQHEPFNPDRIYGRIANEWMERADIDGMRAQIGEILGRKTVLKHCYEIVPHPLNVVLINLARTQGYHHILLERDSEVDRLFSLEVARSTGAWGPEAAERIFAEIRNGSRERPVLEFKSAINQMVNCRLRRTWLLKTFERGNDFTVITFEDLYDDPQVGEQRIEALMHNLGHPQEVIEEARLLIREALSTRGQSSRSIEPLIANAGQWRGRMESLMADFRKNES